MWDWKRIASVATLIGGGVACILVPGLGLAAYGPILAASGVTLAVGTSLKPVEKKPKTDAKK